MWRTLEHEQLMQRESRHLSSDSLPTAPVALVPAISFPAHCGSRRLASMMSSSVQAWFMPVELIMMLHQSYLSMDALCRRPALISMPLHDYHN